MNRDRFQKGSILTKDIITLVQARRENRCLIPVQEEGTTIPLFAIPGLLHYRQLSFYLAPNQPFYCLEKTGYQAIEEIARQYIIELRSIQPNGPYKLCGFCNWGNIALAMADQLTKQGETISLLVLIELFSPNAKLSKFSRKYILQKSAHLFEQLKLQPSFKNKLLLLVRELKNGLIFRLNKYKRVKLEKKSNKIRASNVVLIKAKETYWGMKEDSHMGWLNRFDGQMELFVVEGNHMTILQEPGIVQIAEHLNRALERI